MKTTFIPLLAVSLCLPLLGAKKNDAEEFGYPKRVKDVHATEFMIVEKFGEQVRIGPISKYTHKFDQKGNMVQVLLFVSGKIQYMSTMKYNEKGNMVERVAYDEKGNPTDSTIPKYDEEGNMVESVEYDANGKLRDKTIPKYDEKGDMVEERMYYASGELGTKFIYKYDKKGNKVELSYFYSAAEKLGYKMTNKYDEKGNKVETVEYNEGGKVKNIYTYKFDKSGNKISEIKHGPKTVFGKTRIVPIEEITYKYTYWN